MFSVKQIIGDPAHVRLSHGIVSTLPGVHDTGDKSVTNLGSIPKAHESARGVFLAGLSPNAILELQHVVHGFMGKRIELPERFAESGEVTSL